MRLTQQQSREVYAKHGCYLTEACDNDSCRTLIHYMNRFTKKDDPGVWCSRVCRDGIDFQPGLCRGCKTTLSGKRKGALYCGRACRMRTMRKEVSDPEIIVNMGIQNMALADAISGS